MKKIFIIVISLSGLIVFGAFVSIFVYNNELTKLNILSGIGHPGDKWSINAPKGQYEMVEFVSGEPAVGLRGAKNGHIKNISYRQDKSVIYDVDYIYDSFGRRTVESGKDFSAHKPTQFALFFGCSDLLGIGLNSVDTIPSIFENQTKDYKAYNYGYVGAGVHYVNRIFENENLKPEVSQDNGIIVYVITEGHVPKTLRRAFTLIRPRMPYYNLVDGQPKYEGTLEEVEPTKTFFKKYFAANWLSTIVGGEGITEDMKYTPAEEDYVCTMLKSAQNNSKKQFPNSRFIAFLHVMLPFEDRERISKCAEKEKIEYVSFSVPWDDRFDSDPVYFHPTRLVNELATTELVKYLNAGRPLPKQPGS